MAKDRSSFNDDLKWNTKDLYASDNAALKELDNLNKKIKEIEKYKGKILSSSKSLLEFLELETEISKKLERVYIYGHINNDADTTNTHYQEIFGKIKNLYTEYLSKTSFVIPEMLESEYELVNKYIKENKELKKYERSLKEIYRSKEHILSKDAENALSHFHNIFNSPDEIMGIITDSDFKFKPIIVDNKEVELTESNYSIYLRSKDREVRKQAFESIHSKYEEFKNTLSVILKNEVEKNVASAKLRKYKDSLNASLFSDNIPDTVYYNLIEGIHKNLDTLYEYWDLKKKILNLDELHLYDTYADINRSSIQNSYTYSEAKDLIIEAVKPLGEDYVKNIKKSFANRWIDVCNNKGKRGGAYCTSCYEVHPYVLTSFEGELYDVETIAHELGHAMHYYYACNNQEYQDYAYSIFVAEVASQVNEILLCRYLIDHSNSKEEKLMIIDNLLQKYKSTIYRQTMFAEFELFIHKYTEEGGVLTSENMCQKYYELNELYFGKNVIVDDLIKYEWERIPHFYMDFYVYQYATAYTAATKIANEIYEGNKELRDKYLEFLKLGCTKTPIESLKVAGVDMTKSEVLDDSVKYMKDLIEEYKELMK